MRRNRAAWVLGLLLSWLCSCGDDGASDECESSADCGAGLLCVDSMCVPPPAIDASVDADAGCDPSRVMCGDECVDIQSDTSHCGACGTECGSSPGATISCDNLLCTFRCDEGFADCDGNETNGCETDLAGDDANCGVCRRVCEGGSCVASACLLSPRGDGSAGAFTVTGADAVLNTAITTANGSADSARVRLANPLGFAAGQLVLLHQSRGADAGRFELHRVDRIDADVLSVSPPLTAPFETDAESTAQAVVVPQYESLTVTAGRVLAPAWNGTTGGIVAIAATGTVTVAAGGSIDVTGLGFRAGVSADVVVSTTPGVTGEGHLSPGGAASIVANGSGGGGAMHGGCNRSGGGGGGAGAVAGAPGTVVCSMPAEGGIVAGGDASPIFGGGGGTGGPYYRQPGGAGGGVALIFAETLVVEGTIFAGGMGGASARSFFTSTCGGGGGGGGGGSIFIDVDTAMLGEGLVVARGGAAAPEISGLCEGLLGGAGGAGRINVRANTLTGTTDPPAITP